jgi:hypothetical protein
VTSHSATICRRDTRREPSPEDPGVLPGSTHEGQRALRRAHTDIPAFQPEPRCRARRSGEFVRWLSIPNGRWLRETSDSPKRRLRPAELLSARALYLRVRAFSRVRFAPCMLEVGHELRKMSGLAAIQVSDSLVS